MHPLQCVKILPILLAAQGTSFSQTILLPLVLQPAGKNRIANALCKGGLDSFNHLVLLVGIPLADLALN